VITYKPPVGISWTS